MLNKDYYDRFLKNKDIIFNELINEFGTEYKDIIKNRLDNLIIVFDSTPNEEYDYLKNNKDLINNSKKLKILYNYKQYELARKIAFKNVSFDIKKIISSIFDIDVNNLNDSNMFLFLDDNLNEGLIDSFSSSNEKLLKDNNCPSWIKKNILNDRNDFKLKVEKLGFDINSTPNIKEKVDRYIEERTKLNLIFYGKILERNNLYNNELKQNFDILDFWCLYYISFYDKTNNFKMTLNNKDYEYIYFPVDKLKNNKVKALDTSFIHELIHACLKENKQDIILETYVQSHAINIASKIHNKGLFIFDNKKDYEEKNWSSYEFLLNFISDFLEKNEELLTNLYIKKGVLIVDYFLGENYNELNFKLKKIYELYKTYRDKGSNSIVINVDLDDIKKDIEKIKIYHRNNFGDK